MSYATPEPYGRQAGVMILIDAFRRSGHELLAVARAGNPTHRHLRDRFAVMLVVSAVVDAVASVLMWWAERNAPGTEIRTLGDAVFWTTSQLLTISSSLPNPITGFGRVVDVGLELSAITVVTAMAGSFSAFFHRRGLERHPMTGQAGAGGPGPG